MAVPNTVKNFSFGIEINGLDQFTVQEISGLSKELAEITHGGNLRDVKNPGRATIGDVVLKKVMRTPLADAWAWLWLQQAVDTKTGKMGLAANFKKTVVIKLYAPDGTTVQQRWVLTECWIKKVEYDTLNRSGEDNLFESVTLSVGDFNTL